MTGHLVYSTVHAKDSISAIFRLLDLGVEAYLVANALNLILAQRLVRVLCTTCKKAVNTTPAQNLKMGAIFTIVSIARSFALLPLPSSLALAISSSKNPRNCAKDITEESMTSPFKTGTLAFKMVSVPFKATCRIDISSVVSNVMACSVQ